MIQFKIHTVVDPRYFFSKGIQFSNGSNESDWDSPKQDQEENDDVTNKFQYQSIEN